MQLVCLYLIVTKIEYWHDCSMHLTCDTCSASWLRRTDDRPMREEEWSLSLASEKTIGEERRFCSWRR